VQPRPRTGPGGVGAHGLGRKQGPAIHLREKAGPCPGPTRGSHRRGGCRARRRRRPLAPPFACVRGAVPRPGIR
jgi:hypothetical protein